MIRGVFYLLIRPSYTADGQQRMGEREYCCMLHNKLHSPKHVITNRSNHRNVLGVLKFIVNQKLGWGPKCETRTSVVLESHMSRPDLDLNCKGPKLDLDLLESSILARQFDMRCSTDVAALTSSKIIKPIENKLSLPFPVCLMGRRHGVAYMERQ
ncbi:hypothetical protein ILYODFUR_011134 [Ilyodon furcidens]|uniref:Uncharacterized protein n=1 Tax=Ilyodon furcidens TaxID=33524 RepID=A0ABV0SKM5_9TELE